MVNKEEMGNIFLAPISDSTTPDTPKDENLKKLKEGYKYTAIKLSVNPLFLYLAPGFFGDQH